MPYVKAVLVGLLSTIVLVVLFTLAQGSLAMSGLSGSGGIGAVSVGISEWSVLLAIALGIAAGYWTLRRSLRARVR